MKNQSIKVRPKMILLENALKVAKKKKHFIIQVINLGSILQNKYNRITH